MKSFKLKKTLKTLVIIGTLSQPNILMASSPGDDICAPEVKTCIAKCDDALAESNKVVNLKTRAIAAQQSVIDLQDVQIKELANKKSNLFDNPMFYVVVGLVVGGYAVGRVK